MHVRISTVNGVVSRHAAALRIVVLLVVALGAVAPARGYLFTRIADTNTPIPGGNGNFTSFDPSSVPGPQSTFVTFRGFGADGQEGIYTGRAPNVITRIADRNTVMPVPGGPVTFQSFGAPSAGFGPIFFHASGGGTGGIFRADGTALTAVDSAPTSTTFFGRPGATSNNVSYLRNGVVMSSRNGGAPTTETFNPPSGVVLQSFGDPDLGFSSLGVRVNYLESGLPRTGVLYRTTGSPDQILFAGPNGFTSEASVSFNDTAAAIQGDGQSLVWRHFFNQMDQTLGPPSGFNQFRDVSAGDPNLGVFDTEVAFSVSGSAGEAIYYQGRPAGLDRLIATGDTFDGRIVQGVSLGRDSQSGLTISFLATFTDGSSAIYRVGIPEPATCGLVAPVMLLLTRRTRTAPAVGSFRQARSADLV